MPNVFVLHNCKFYHWRLGSFTKYLRFFLCRFLWWEENLRELRESIFQKIQALEKSPAPTKNWALWEISPQITHMFVRPIQGASLDPSYIINLVISVCGVSPALVNFVKIHANFWKLLFLKCFEHFLTRISCIRMLANFKLTNKEELEKKPLLKLRFPEKAK